jgi:uncharacterized SAM-binding protein YcdF (DUF218 family)
MQSAKTTRRLIACVLVVLLVALGVMAFRRVGRWLVRQDPLSPAGAIVVLSGGMPYRSEEAAQVFREGYAQQVWLTRPSSPEDELKKLGVSFVADEQYEREVLVKGGVPRQAVHVLPDEIVNTQQEIEEIVAEMQRVGTGKVIIVTSPAHTRRVRALWTRIAPANCLLVLHAAYEEPYEADYWWRNTRDALAVFREMLGLLNAWAGLPIRPHAV